MLFPAGPLLLRLLNNTLKHIPRQCSILTFFFTDVLMIIPFFLPTISSDPCSELFPPLHHGCQCRRCCSQLECRTSGPRSSSSSPRRSRSWRRSQWQPLLKVSCCAFDHRVIRSHSARSEQCLLSKATILSIRGVHNQIKS